MLPTTLPSQNPLSTACSTYDLPVTRTVRINPIPHHRLLDAKTLIRR